jgi:hypothetical protein
LCDLKVDTTPVFYLLAECANESIWLKINVVTCTDQSGTEISKVQGNLIKEYWAWPMTLNIANTKWSSHLGKTNVISFAMAAGWKIDRQLWDKLNDGTGWSNPWNTNDQPNTPNVPGWSGPWNPTWPTNTPTPWNPKD